MSFSRRGLLKAGATLASVPFLAACGKAGATPTYQGLPSESLEVYRGQIGSSFRLAKARGSLQLVAVKDLTPVTGPEGEVFALTFVGAADGPARQDVLELDHARLGGGQLLLVPGGIREDGMRYYTAVINHQVV
jgi:hypothetical protein